MDIYNLNVATVTELWGTFISTRGAVMVIWASWCLKSATTRLFFWLIVQTYNKEQLKSPHPIGGSTSHRTKKLQWRHNGRDSVSNHQPHDCLLNLLFRRRSKKSSKLRLTGLFVGNSPGTVEYPAQMVSLSEKIPIWRRHRDMQSVSVSILLWNAFSRHQRALHTTTQAHH